jgi:hydroxyacylglutathione hydrolase
VIVEQIWTANKGANYNYIVACGETGEALAIDPVEHELCLARAKDKGWDITQIVNTHEHGDHIAGNAAMVEATGAKLFAHENAGAKIPGMDGGLAAGDVVKVGASAELDVLDTPGHTLIHICLLTREDTPALIAGDTIFNAGAGNCRGGDPELLYETFTTQLAKLPENTRVYSGHDYFEHNLGFTLDREPDNARAKEILGLVKNQDPADPLITTLGLEKEINCFFRLSSPGVIENLRQSFPDLEAQPGEKTVFLKLRELRNSW